MNLEKLADLLLKNPKIYATSKFDVGKTNSPLRLPLKLEQYEIISTVKKEEQTKGNTFINPVIILAKGESLKIVFNARYLNSPRLRSCTNLAGRK